MWSTSRNQTKKERKFARFKTCTLRQGHPHCTAALGGLLQPPTERPVRRGDLPAKIYLMQEHSGFHPELLREHLQPPLSTSRKPLGAVFISNVAGNVMQGYRIGCWAGELQGSRAAACPASLPASSRAAAFRLRWAAASTALSPGVGGSRRAFLLPEIGRERPEGTVLSPLKRGEM